MDEFLKRITAEIFEDVSSEIMHYVEDEMYDRLPGPYEYADNYEEEAEDYLEPGEEIEPYIEDICNSISDELRSCIEEALDNVKKNLGIE